MSVLRRQRSQIRKQKPAPKLARPIMEVLESRWMMSADLVPVELPIVDLAPWPPVPAVVADLDVPRRELVVIDGGLPDLDTLVAGIVGDTRREVEVVVLAPDSDGFAQLTELLSQRADLDALHVISHGRAGALQLGDVTLDADALDVRAAALAKWHRAFRAGADILLYGCDLAGNLEGVRFLETLGALAGTDVAASDDATGAAALGGDWMLEYRLGTVETALAVNAGTQLAYDGLLALHAEDGFVVTGNLDGAGSGAGWGGAWSVAVTSMLATGLDLSDPGDLLATSGSSAIGNLTVPSTSVTAIRNLGAAIGADGTTTWIGFLVQPDSTGAGATMGLEFGNAAGDVAFAGYDGTSFVLQKADGTGRVTVGGISASAGQGAFVVVRIDSAAGNDTISMYVNPTPGRTSPDATFTAVKSDLDLGTFTRIGIANARGAAANSAMLDEIRVGTSFADVAPTLVVSTALDTNISGIVGGNAAHTIAWLHAHQGPFVSLREAIIAANNTAGADTIRFSIDGAGPHTILLASALPVITDAVTIDGTSDVDYAGAPVAIVNGSLTAGGATGIELQSSNNAILGLEIREFGGAGIRVVSGSTGNTIADNVVTANGGAGIALASPAAGAVIRTNLIHANAGQGIDLGADGAVAVNDAGDTDAGANDLLNFPVIYGVTLSGGVVTITGEAAAGAVVEFYESTNDASGHGEGVSLIGSGTVGGTGTAGTADATAIQFSLSFAQGTLVVTSEFSANVTVTELNAAPVLDAAASPVLSAVLEDAVAPAGAVGTLVSQLVDFATPGGQMDNVTDANTSPQLGIAITAADATLGAWWYTVDGGATWLALGVPTPGAARQLAADASTRLYHRPNADTNGALATAITFRAWDRATGSNGGTADTTANGGTTAFSSATDTASLVITAVNDAPVNTAPASVAGHRDTPITFATVTNRVAVADVDAGGVVVTVTLAADNGGVVTLTGIGGLVFTTGDGAADAAMVFTGTVADINAALNGMVLTPGAGYSGTATLTLTTDDGGNTGSGGARSDTDVITLTLSPTAAAVVTLPGTPVTFTEGGADVDVDASLTIADADSTHLVSAVVAISGNYQAVEDRLLFTDQLGITGTWDGSLGVLTLSGTATLADYQTALRRVAYRNTSDAPSVAIRSLSFAVDDGAGSGALVTTTLTVVADNDAPMMTVPGAQTVLEDTDLVFLAALGNAVTITDPDAGMDGALVELTATGGTLHLAGTTGIGFGSGADGTAAMAIGGTVANLNAALNGLVFRPAANATAGVTLRFYAYDFGNYGLGGPKSDTELVTVMITPVNDVPVITANTGATLLEGGTVVLAPGQLAATDVEDAAALLSYVVQSLPTHGTLRRGGIALGVGERFTQADITNGVVSYVHDGSETTVDAFGFDLLDTGLAGPVANTFTFTVTPVDDPVALSAVQLTVPVGAQWCLPPACSRWATRMVPQGRSRSRCGT